MIINKASLLALDHYPDPFRQKFVNETSDYKDVTCSFIETVDIAPLIEELNSRDDWNLDQYRNKISYHTDTENIILVKLAARPGTTPDHYIHIHETMLGPVGDQYPVTLKWVQDFADRVDSILGRVALVKLKPHTKVKPHFDVGRYYLPRDRYHLVLDSNDSMMHWDTGTFHWKSGELWWFNNKIRHWSTNPTDMGRIHLIFDVLPKRNIEIVEQMKRYTDYYKG